LIKKGPLSTGCCAIVKAANKRHAYQIGHAKFGDGRIDVIELNGDTSLPILSAMERILTQHGG
jgi:hypothetical protein